MCAIQTEQYVSSVSQQNRQSWLAGLLWLAVSILIPMLALLTLNTPALAEPAIQPTGSIGNRVWFDRDGDAVQDRDSDAAIYGEFGITDVTVQAVNSSGDIFSAVSDASGYYTITALAAGVYTVTLQGGFPPPYNDITTRESFVVHLPSDGRYLGADFGLRNLWRGFGNRIWYDADADGHQNTGEPGIGNVTIGLYGDTSLDDQFSPSEDLPESLRISGGVGEYVLSVMGDYDHFFVNVSDKHGILIGLSNTVGEQSLSSPTGPLTATNGTIRTDVDFGYVLLPGIGRGVASGLLWLDEDQDGECDETEVLLANVEVCATPVAGGTASCDDTDLNGRYFLTLANGVHQLETPTLPFGLQPAIIATRRVTITEGVQQIAEHFPLVAASAAQGAVAGDIWQDSDICFIGGWPNCTSTPFFLIDGVFDPTLESIIPQIAVDLIDDLDGDGVIDEGEPFLTTHSDGEGRYRFEHLPTGAYLVRPAVERTFYTTELLPYFRPTKPGPNPHENDNHHQIPYALTLIANETDDTIDFGYQEPNAFAADPIQPGRIGDLVWEDRNHDGVYQADGTDRPLAGVTVEVRANSTPVKEATSGNDGRYLLVGLPLTDYQVVVTDRFEKLTNYEPTPPGAPGIDANSQMQPYTVNLTPAAPANLTADFGYKLLPGLQPGDCNGNDIVDAGDLSALILEIFDDDGQWTADAGGAGFLGSAGCDSNRDAVINAGDLSCLVLIIFNGPDGCPAQARASAEQMAALGVDAQLLAEIEQAAPEQQESPPDAPSGRRYFLPVVVR